MQDLEFYKIWADGQDPKVPEKAVLDWWCSDNKQYHCIFCGNHGNHSHFLQNIFPKPGKIMPINICSCGEYKGIEPCIPGYCFFGEG